MRLVEIFGSGIIAFLLKLCLTGKNAFIKVRYSNNKLLNQYLNILANAFVVAISIGAGYLFYSILLHYTNNHHLSILLNGVCCMVLPQILKGVVTISSKFSTKPIATIKDIKK